MVNTRRLSPARTVELQPFCSVHESAPPRTAARNPDIANAGASWCAGSRQRARGRASSPGWPQTRDRYDCGGCRRPPRPQQRARRAHEVEARLGTHVDNAERSGSLDARRRSQSKAGPPPKTAGEQPRSWPPPPPPPPPPLAEGERVITASVRPRRRETRAGPMSTANAATTTAAPEPQPRSQPRRAVSETPTAARPSTTAICPRLISPAHPVRTTTDMR